MSETLTKVVVDCSTGEQSIIELTEEEIAQRDLEAKEFAKIQKAEKAAADAKAAARASALTKLAELGLTEEEIQAL